MEELPLARFILTLGAAGSGKTTGISSMVRQLAGQVELAVVFNDDGDPAAADLPEDLGKYADITSLTNGCFGCTDAATFLDRVQELSDTLPDDAVVFIEPVGFTDADEMISTLAEVGVVPIILAMVDAAHHARNLKFGTTEGHARAAHCILVTKIDDADSAFDAEAWSKQFCTDVRIFRPEEELDISSILAHQVHDCGHHHAPGETCSHGHDHSHDHDHGHNHDGHVSTFHARFGPGVQVQQIRTIVDAHPGVLRAKGDVGEVHFDMVQGTWNESEAGSPVGYITFYTAPADAQDGQACLEALRPHYATGWGGLTGTAAATRGGEVDVETVRYQLGLCLSKPLTFSAGHPVPNPEWHELLNELRKRPGVPEDLAQACVAARVDHYMNCARWYLDNRDREQDSVAPLRLHAVAVGVAWFVSEMSGRLDPKVIEEAAGLPISRWLQIGLQARERINRSVGKELVIADEAGVSARWAQRVGQSVDELEQVWTHNVGLAEVAGNDEVAEAWRASWQMIAA